MSESRRAGRAAVAVGWRYDHYQREWVASVHGYQVTWQGSVSEPPTVTPYERFTEQFAYEVGECSD